MGLSGVSPLSLLLILVIVIVLFGTSRLKTMAADLGEAIQNFRKTLNEEHPKTTKEDEKPQ